MSSCNIQVFFSIIILKVLTIDSVFVILFMSSSDAESLIILVEWGQVEQVRIGVGHCRPVSPGSVCRHLLIETHVRPCLNFEWNNLFQKMLPLKDVTEAILALRRNGYSSYLLTHRTGSSSPPIHTRLDSPTHQLVAGALQRWTIGSNLEPDRSRPLEL